MSNLAIQDVLFFLVISSQEEQRANLAKKTLENLSRLLETISIDLIILDNGSTIKDYKNSLPAQARLVESAVNLGYWSAIYWILNEDSLKKKYIYIIESDLIHSSLEEIVEVKKFLDANPDIHCVRTQEFSVRFRWLFDKKLKFLPFHKTRSEISLRNYVTGERAWFKKANGFHGIYRSNLHPKLPSFHRWDVLRSQFDKLRERGFFTEGDYFRIGSMESPCIGVLVPGLYHALATRKNANVVPSSSYLNKLQIEPKYIPSREARILLYEKPLGFST